MKMIGRNKPLFDDDLLTFADIKNKVAGKSFLVIGAGTIGHAVKEIFARSPAKLHVVDISENNLVELVRDIVHQWRALNVIFQHLLWMLVAVNLKLLEIGWVSITF